MKHLGRRSIIDFIARRGIAAGEEIRTDYSGDPDSKKNVWFEVEE